VHELLGPPFDDAVEPRRGDVEGLGELAHLHQRG
jgi:hypothetical protein